MFELRLMMLYRARTQQISLRNDSKAILEWSREGKRTIFNGPNWLEGKSFLQSNAPRPKVFLSMPNSPLLGVAPASGAYTKSLAVLSTTSLSGGRING